MVGFTVGTGSAVADAPRDLEDYVILGITRVHLGKRTFIAEGNVGVNGTAGGTLIIESRGFMPDDAAVVADQLVPSTGVSLFDVFTNDLAPPRGQVVIRGTGPTGFLMPIAAVLPPLPSFAPGTTPVIVAPGVSGVLEPGAYGAVVVQDEQQLQLTGGTYELTSLVAGKKTKVLIAAPSTINVEGDFEIGKFSGFGPASSAVGARQIKVNVGGRFVRFASPTHVDMDLLAPNAQVRLGRSFRGEGRFIGNEIVGEQTSNFRHPKCGNGTIEPGEECDDGGRVASDGCSPTCQLDAAASGLRASVHDQAPAAEPATFCTVTQQELGASNGVANGPEGLVTLHPEVLPVTVGAPGILSVKVPDQARLVCFLPAEGTPAALCTGLDGCDGDTVVSACGNPPILDFIPSGDGASGGQGGGGLTGQVITASVNVALSNLGATPVGLANFLLPRRLCTTKCPAGRDIDPTTMERQAAAVGIADGLTSVGDLLALANQALSSHCARGTCDDTARSAFAPPNPIRIGSIEVALGSIAECFAGCATVIPCAH